MHFVQEAGQQKERGAKKRVGGGGAHAVTSSPSRPTFHVACQKSGMSFLVDPGSDVSFVKVNTDNDRQLIKFATAANKTSISMYYKKTMTIQLNGKNHVFEFVHSPDISQNILGADFMRHFRLDCDVVNRCLKQHTQPADYKIPAIAAIRQTPTTVDQLFSEFPEIAKVDFNNVKHKVVHHIPTSGRPVHAKARRLNPELEKVARAEFAELEKLGVIRRAISPWSSPLQMVKKCDGTYRACGDYRQLNNVTEKDRYPVPHIHSFSDRFSGAKIFSKLDITKGYYHIPMAEEDVAKTAVITPFGSFEFLRMPFGLSGATQSFQRFMDTLLQDLPDCYIYIDDILVASKTEEEHFATLHELFNRLHHHGLAIKREKCEFLQPQLKFLGHIISTKGVEPTPEKTADIAKAEPPETVRGMKRFIGSLNFFNRFLRGAATILAPLYAVTNNQKMSKRIAWDTKLATAFDAAKQSLVHATSLAFLDPAGKLAMAVDASDFAVGAVLFQTVKGTHQPLGFFSRKLQPAQAKYSAFDRELLAAFSAVKRFRRFLEGRSFTLFTDHRPLVTAMCKQTEAQSPRQARHLSFISEFTTDIQYIKGEDNDIADFLSRLNTQPALTVSAVNFSSLAVDQQHDKWIQRLLKVKPKDVKLIESPYIKEKVYCDIRHNKVRPLIPATYRRDIISEIHDVCHYGALRTAKMVGQRYTWPGSRKDCIDYVKKCHGCQKGKITKRTVTPIKNYSEPSGRFAELHVDLVGKLEKHSGYEYVFTIIDRFTRNVMAVPMKTISAENCAKALYNHWICHYGVPAKVVSDRGTQFTSRLWHAIGRYLGFETCQTTSYHPQCNGMVERWHRDMKSALKIQCQKVRNWPEMLPSIVLGLKVAPRDDTRGSPAQLTFGQQLRLPGEFVPANGAPEPSQRFLEQMQKFFASVTPFPVKHNRVIKTHVPRELTTCKQVWLEEVVKAPLTPQYHGPYDVIKKADKYFVVDIDGRHESILLDRLKPVIG